MSNDISVPSGLKLLGSLTYEVDVPAAVPFNLGIPNPLSKTSSIVGPTNWASSFPPASGAKLSTLKVLEDASVTFGCKKL